MIDLYFKRPVLWDYCIAMATILTAYFFYSKGSLVLPKEEYVYSMVSDLATISLTMVGFILTLLTLLISFKSTSKVDGDLLKESDTVFDIFFASTLYFETTKHLKNGIKSLTAMALLGYLLKMIVVHEKYELLFGFCFLGVTIIIMTVIRSMLILHSILKMQQHPTSE